MSIIQRTLTIFLIFICSGCAGGSLQSNAGFDKLANFNKSTYAWHVTSKVDLGIKDVDDAKIEAWIKQSIKNELNAKALSYVESVPGDILVGFQVAVQDGCVESVMQDVYKQKYIASFDQWDHPNINKFPIESGSLIIDIIDPEAKKIIWRGVTHTKVLQADVDEVEKIKIINIGINTIFEKFPLK